MSLLGNLKPKHLVTASVAVTMAIFAFNYGGYGSETGAVLAFVSWLLILAAVGFALVPRSRLGGPALISLSLLAALTLFTALSIVWSDDAGLAYQRMIEMLGILGIFIGVLLTGKRGEGRSWLWGITFGLGLIVFLAALSRFIPGIGGDAELTRELGSIVGGRLSWPLGYWNAIGAVSASFVVLCVWHAVHGQIERHRNFAIAAIPTTAAVLYLCSSRGSVMAMTVGIALILGLGPRRRDLISVIVLGIAGSIPVVALATQLPDVVHASDGSTADWQGLLLMLVTIGSSVAVALGCKPAVDRLRSLALPPRTVAWLLLGAGVVGLTLVILSDPVERFSAFTTIPFSGVNDQQGSTFATSHLLSESGNGRWQLWQSALRAFESQPLLGIGSGGFEAWFKSDGSFWMQTIDTHSMPLQVLAELGSLGFLLLIGFAGSVVNQAVRRYRELGRTDRGDSERAEMVAFLGLLLVGTISVSIDWSGDMPAVYGPIVAGTAVLVGPAYAVPARRGSMKNVQIRYAMIGAVLLFCGGSMYVSARQYESSHNIEISRSAFDAGDGNKAVKEAERAVSATPWSGQAYAQLATVQESTGHRPAALASAIVATEKSPKNDSFWILRSDLQYRMGLRGAAYVSSLTARLLNPKSLYWYVDGKPSPALGPLPTEPGSK